MKQISDNIKAILALILVVGCLLYIFMITFIYRGDSNILSQALIAIVTALSTATGYYFGYSQGAAKKDEALSQMADKATVEKAETVNVTTGSTTNNNTNPTEDESAKG